VLLAFAFFPAVAQAGDSSAAEYEEALPTIPGKTQDKNPAKSSRTDGGSGQSSMGSGSSSETGTSDGDSSDDKGGAAAPNRDGGSGQGNQGQGSKGDDRKRVGAGPTGQPTGAAPISHDDDGGSPLVPILIALAVLAAISIGVVAMRKRRQDAGPGSSASPEAS
jgi:cobalamin biosynthesis Mg chelatase CobN